MQSNKSQFDVRLIPGGTRDQFVALHRVMGLKTRSDGAPAPAVEQMLRTAQRGSHSLDLLFGAYDGDRLVAAALGLVTEGSTALVLLSNELEHAETYDGTLAALRRLVETSRRQSINLLEVLTEPGTSALSRILREGGFRRLTQLRYLRRTAARFPEAIRNSPDLAWVPFSPAVQPLFERTLDLTYAQTHDCPELSGIRATSDVLAGHRATGVFDPALWWVATRDGEPVGVLLLSRLPSHAALEIVYMGVAQPFRRQGVAHALLHRAVDAVGRVGAKELTLAVDERNMPARRAYARWGFTEFGRRDAWIASIDPL